MGYHKFTKQFASSSLIIWHYNHWWILASSKIVLCCSRSCILCLQLLTLINSCSCWVVFILSILFPISEGSHETFFKGLGLSASCPTSNLEEKGIPLRLGRHLDLCNMGGPTSSHATASRAFRFI